MNERLFENIIIIVLLMVIFILLYPFVLKNIEASKLDTAITNTKSTVSYVNNLYYNEQINGEVALPFKVEFNENGFKTYMNNQEVSLDTDKKNDKTLPKEGTVTIIVEGQTYAKDLKFYDYKCSETIEGKIECSK